MKFCSGDNGQRVIAAVSAATTTKLTVIVPQGIETGFVTVEVADTVSNEYPFSAPNRLLIAFGDNGNFNDDVFKLSVNNKVLYDNNQPQRKIGPISVTLEEGTHQVKLTGIRADDGIATYYIEFSGDVANVSGDELTGRDLCPDTHKNYEVTIGNNSNSHQFRANQFTLKSNLQVENRARTDEQTECPKVESN